MVVREMPVWRDTITGVRYEQCDVCGGTFPEQEVMGIDGRTAEGNYEVMFQVCDDCWEDIFRGEIDPALILMDDDERAEAGH